MDNQKELLAELERGLSELKEKIAVMEKLIAEYNRTETFDSEENGEMAEHIELVHEDFLPEISEAVQEETAPEITATSETAVGDLPAAEEDAPESVFGELWGESKPAAAKKPAPRTLNDVNAAVSTRLSLTPDLTSHGGTPISRARK